MDNAYQLGVYLHLAQASKRRRRPLVRDRMLLLAAAVAANMRLTKLTAYCRQEILEHNPRHLVGQWETVEEALLQDEFLGLLKQVRRKYSVERSERLLESLGIEIANERDTYYRDEEYAAAILGLDPKQLLEESDDS